MISPDTILWFAVQVIPQHEFKVSEQLRSKGQEEFLPSITIRRRWSDRNKLIHQPLFPGYVFGRLRRSSFATVLGTPGVCRIVSFGGKAHPICNEEIDRIRRVVNCGREVTATPYFTLGQMVQVISGPLCGLIGIVDRVKNRDRLIISIDMLMRSVAVEIMMSELVLYNESEFPISSEFEQRVFPSHELHATGLIEQVQR
jgi:transcriptional antiterminator NusG